MHRSRSYGWLIFLFLLSFLATGLFINQSISEANSTAATVAVVVEPGDTLWSIAREHMGQEGDPRRLIYEISRLNGLESPLIYPGQTLLLPDLQQK